MTIFFVQTNGRIWFGYGRIRIWILSIAVLQYSIHIIIIILTIKLKFKGPRVKTGSPNPIPPALVCLNASFIYHNIMNYNYSISDIYCSIIYMIVILKQTKYIYLILSILWSCIIIAQYIQYIQCIFITLFTTRLSRFLLPLSMSIFAILQFPNRFIFQPSGITCYNDSENLEWEYSTYSTLFVSLMKNKMWSMPTKSRSCLPTPSSDLKCLLFVGFMIWKIVLFLCLSVHCFVSFKFQSGVLLLSVHCSVLSSIDPFLSLHT